MLNDACNGVVWEDDAQICWMLKSKCETAQLTGSTTLYVKELEPDKQDYQIIIDAVREYISQEE